MKPDEQYGSSLSAWTKRLSVVSSVQETVAAVLAMIDDVLGAHGIAFAERDEGDHVQALVVSKQSTTPSRRLLSMHGRHPLTDTLQDGRLRTFESLEVLAAEYPALESRARAGDDSSWVHVPIEHEQHVVAVTGIGFPATGSFDDHLIRRCVDASYIAWAALQRVMMSQRIAEAERTQAAIADRARLFEEATVALDAAETPEVALQTALDLVTSLLDDHHEAVAGNWSENGLRSPGAVVSESSKSPTYDLLAWADAAADNSTGALIATLPKFLRARTGATAANRALVVPLAASGARLGIVVVTFGPAVAGDETMLTTASTFGRQVGSALDRMRMRDRERQLADTLQDALRTAGSVDVPGLRIAVRYVTPPGTWNIGGDWYQVIPLSGDAVALSVGDVVGRGLIAAATMGQYRNFIAGAAINDASPAHVMDSLDSVTRVVPDGLCTTVAYCVLDTSTGGIRYACAGHPPPLLVRADGTASFLEEGRRSPLGVEGTRAAPGGEETLGQGDHLVLYTDGLIERRGEDLAWSLERLRVVASKAADLTPEAAATFLVDSLVRESESSPDDVTVLWVTYDGRSRPPDRLYDAESTS